jgi:hypothetical protein
VEGLGRVGVLHRWAVQRVAAWRRLVHPRRR